MNQKPRKRYTTEFKAQAVELLDTGKPVEKVAEDLCISSSMLYRWRLDSQGGSPGPQAGGGGAGAADDLRALRRENAILKQENDILKKAAVILGTRPQLNSGK
jgi:transposase